MNSKTQFFEKELAQYDLTEDKKNYIRGQMLEGLEIWTKKEITKCIEGHIETMGFL